MALFGDLLFEFLHEIHGMEALRENLLVFGVPLLYFCPFETYSLIEERVEIMKAREFEYGCAQQYKFDRSVTFLLFEHALE